MECRKMSLVDIGSNREDLIVRVIEMIEEINKKRGFPKSEILQDLESVLEFKGMEIRRLLK